MGDPYSISALIISGLTVIGTVLVHYDFKHCKSGCCESDCFPREPHQHNFSRSTSPIQDWQPRASEDGPHYISEEAGAAMTGQQPGLIISFTRDGSPKITQVVSGNNEGAVRFYNRENSPNITDASPAKSPRLATVPVPTGQVLLDEIIEIHRIARTKSPLCEDIN